MELNTVLSIAIPVIGFFAFLSGYFFGKSDGIKETTILIGNTKKTEFDMKYRRGFCDGFSSGKKYAVENYAEVKKDNEIDFSNQK